MALINFRQYHDRKDAESESKPLSKAEEDKLVAELRLAQKASYEAITGHSTLDAVDHTTLQQVMRLLNNMNEQVVTIYNKYNKPKPVANNSFAFNSVTIENDATLDTNSPIELGPGVPWDLEVSSEQSFIEGGIVGGDSGTLNMGGTVDANLLPKDLDLIVPAGVTLTLNEDGTMSWSSGQTNDDNGPNDGGD